MMFEFYYVKGVDENNLEAFLGKYFECGICGGLFQLKDFQGFVSDKDKTEPVECRFCAESGRQLAYQDEFHSIISELQAIAKPLRRRHLQMPAGYAPPENHRRESEGAVNAQETISGLNVNSAGLLTASRIQ